MTLPLVTVILPTLNAARYLDECLGALRSQDWPRDRLEIVLADAGSTDDTLAIAERHEVDVVRPNPLKTAEAGKAVAIRAARGELICSVDSDNVVVGRDWLRRMTAPFSDPDVIAAEAARFQHRRQDGFINRWHALAGVADPLTLYTGNYARDSYVTGTWTGMPHDVEPRDGWDKITLDPDAVPVLGANGFVIRRTAFDAVPLEGDYYFDLDYVDSVVRAGHRTIARVDAEVRHYFCDGVRQYAKKTRRRADDFFFFSSTGSRSYPWTRQRQLRMARFVVSTITIVPLLGEAARGFRRKPDVAWLFHVPACWITLAVYGIATIRGKVAPRMLDREAWRQ
jgi:glycosyltransferase involved in cell wall biosynthesis